MFRLFLILPLGSPCFPLWLSLFFLWLSLFSLWLSLFSPWLSLFSLWLSLFFLWLSLFSLWLSLFSPWLSLFSLWLSLFSMFVVERLPPDSCLVILMTRSTKLDGNYVYFCLKCDLGDFEYVLEISPFGCPYVIECLSVRSVYG